MPTARRGRPAIAALLAAVALLVGMAMAPVTAAETYRRELYFTAGYERQIDSRTCVAASTAMMLNLVARRDLRLDQMTILRYAQTHDALVDSRQRGSDPLGWSRALTHYSTLAGRGPFSYGWESYGTEYGALKRAARQLVRTSRPVGLLVQNGRHAVVMTGFESTRDPRLGEFRLINVWISDPAGLTRRFYAVAESPLNRYLELDATREYDEAWYGKYVIVVPLS
jgi:hypothetical protein